MTYIDKCPNLTWPQMPDFPIVEEEAVMRRMSRTAIAAAVGFLLTSGTVAAAPVAEASVNYNCRQVIAYDITFFAYSTGSATTSPFKLFYANVSEASATTMAVIWLRPGTAIGAIRHPIAGGWRKSLILIAGERERRPSTGESKAVAVMAVGLAAASARLA